MNGDSTKRIKPKSVGVIERRGSYWQISAEPACVISMKRNFVRVDKAADGEIRILSTPDVDADIQWFREKWLLEMSDKDEALLHRGAEVHRERTRTAAEVEAGTFVPREFHGMLRPPRDYQRVAADLCLKNTSLLCADDLGCGKLQPVDTPVLTPTGYRPIGSLCVGDLVIGSTGRPVTVTAIYPQGVKPNYRVTFADGSSTEAGDEHLWTLYYHKGGRDLAPITVTTEQLRTGATLTSTTSGRKTRLDLAKTSLFLPMLSAPVEFAPVEQLPIPPYTLGALIANGSLSVGAMLTVNTLDLAHVRGRVRSEGSHVGKTSSYEPHTATRMAMTGLMPRLRALGLNVLSGKKHIPDMYLRAAVADRIALLHGLMDGDGTCSAERNRVSYSSTSERLAHDLVGLVECLGGVASVRRYDRGEKGIDFCVRVRMPATVPPFSLPRKADRYHPVRRATPTRGLAKIEYTRDVESVCIRVDAPDALYCTEHAILTHNTHVALTMLSETRTLPAVVVTVTALPLQWQEQIASTLPHLRTHVLNGTTPYNIPERCHMLAERARKEAARAGEELPAEWPRGEEPDVIILPYSRLVGWMDVLKHRATTFVIDEAQEFRHTDTEKYRAAKAIRERATYCLGLSATPTHNYGGEYHSVVEMIRPGALGTREEFFREYCVDVQDARKARLADPRSFGYMLRASGIMIRRTRKDVGRELPPLTIIPTHIDSDTGALERVKHRVFELARTILNQNPSTNLAKMQAGGEMDRLLRQATGIAKAPYIAAFIRMLVESGESVLVFAWHIEVYAILKMLLAGDPEKDIEDLKPAFHTGQESEKQKREALASFIAGKTKVLIMSLRSGAGIDGLQHVCKTVVHAELDWSPNVHDQGTGRINRDGQQHPVFAYYLLANQGSDPIVADVCGAKRSNTEPARNPDESRADVVETDPAHIRKLAQAYLDTHK